MDSKKSTGEPGAPRKVEEAGKRIATAPSDLASEKSMPPTYDWLGPSLRRMYDEVLNEPIPEPFVDLLQQLYDRQKKRQS